MARLFAVLFATALAVMAGLFALQQRQNPAVDAELDARLRDILTRRRFTGRIEEKLEERLGRRVDPQLAEVGRMLFFDPVLSLNGDNSCSGCHGPNVSFNGSQSIAIGVGNNGIVGPGRRGPSNQRRAPTLLNAAFFPRLMWDSRFSSETVDPFRNSQGFLFPPPDGENLSHLDHLLIAQAFTPVINRVEMTGFAFEGDHDVMRAAVTKRVDDIPEYRRLFGGVFAEIAEGQPLRFEHLARALAEFQFTLIRADAPIDAYSRGDSEAMTTDEKKGAILFFGNFSCAECHMTHDYSNEMFSDFETHVLAVPQVTPTSSMVTFDGPGANEDYGVEQVTGRPEDRYRFRTSPIRNAVYQPSYMHNGAYLCLDEAIRHHLNAFEQARAYSPSKLDENLQAPLGPIEPILEILHPFIRDPLDLSDDEFEQIFAFVAHGLTDPDAAPEALMDLIPDAVPSGLPVHDFEPPALPKCRVPGQ